MIHKMILFGVLIWVAPAQADNVLDFEGEVITGESRRPDLFLQLAKDNPDMDSLIYLRKNFNDYHEVDRKRRPLFELEQRQKGRRDR